MNKPERLPHPDFAHWLPAGLRDIADDQKAIPRIAKDAALMKEIEAALPAIPTTHDLWRGDARALDFIPDNSVHLVLTSPPYWTLKQYNASAAQMGDIRGTHIGVRSCINTLRIKGSHTINPAAKP